MFTFVSDNLQKAIQSALLTHDNLLQTTWCE